MRMVCRLKTPMDLNKLFHKARKAIIIREESPLKVKVFANSERDFEQARRIARVFIDQMERKEIAIRVSLGIWDGPEELQPVVEVTMPPLGVTRYGRVTENLAKEIIRKHIMGKKVMWEHLISQDMAPTLSKADRRYANCLPKGRS